MNVVSLHGDAPLLMDIPGQLRSLADAIEAGNYGEVDAFFGVMPRSRDFPEIFGWGPTSAWNDALLQFELARHGLLRTLID